MGARETTTYPTQPTSNIGAAHLRRLEMELAKHIALAAHLAHRAACSGGDLNALTRQLAPEIADEQQQPMLLEACWRITKNK